jgi:hypothetical protein
MTDYAEMRKACEADFDRITAKYGLPYYPNVTAGWDSSPRTVQSDVFDNSGYPYMSTIGNNTPAEFEKALRFAKKKLDESALRTKMLTINAWNEWTEGSYIEPDVKTGYARLEAIKRVFLGENA